MTGQHDQRQSIRASGYAAIGFAALTLMPLALAASTAAGAPDHLLTTMDSAALVGEPYRPSSDNPE